MQISESLGAVLDSKKREKHDAFEIKKYRELNQNALDETTDTSLKELILSMGTQMVEGT